MKHHFLLIQLILLALLAGCSKSGAGDPNFLKSESAEEGATNEPAMQMVSGVEKLIYHLGPVDLPPKAQGSDGVQDPIVLSFQVDEAKWLVGFEPRVVDSKGNDLPSELLHQAVVINKNEENALCPGSSGNPFLMSNALLTQANFPSGYAYPLLSTDPLEAEVMLKNESGESYSGVYLELTFLVRPMDAMADFKDLRPVLMEKNPCDHVPPDLPPLGLVEENVSAKLPFAGNLVMSLGLLQDYGAELVLSKNSEPEPIWRMTAQIDEDHKLVELTNNPYEDPAGISVREGDDLTLRYSYNNTKEVWLKYASASAILYISQE